MGSGSLWDLTPRESIEAECVRRGKDEVLRACVDLILGQDVDPALFAALGGPGATKFLDGNPHDDRYWLRVWGTRGLLWAWDDTAMSAIDVALHDEAWRVREMALKEFWQDCVVADYVKVMNDPAKKNDGTRPNVLPFYSGFF